jgi:Cys-tRNA(Pro) deacylase
MPRKKTPTTPAIRLLREQGIEYSEHSFKYEPHGGTSLGAKALGVDEHLLIKTLIFEDDNKRPLIVLMHGDQQVSTRQLARYLKVKSITPCTPQTATKHSGYQVGGTSPFGMRRSLPIYIQRSILELPYIYINGGRRGFLVNISTQDLQALLQAPLVEVAI